MTRLPSLPTIDVRSLDLTELDDKVVAALKTAAYLTVGLGVTAFERLDATRRAAGTAATDALESLTGAVAGTVRRATKLSA
jgi:hypothetical protein